MNRARWLQTTRARAVPVMSSRAGAASATVLPCCRLRPPKAERRRRVTGLSLSVTAGTGTSPGTPARVPRRSAVAITARIVAVAVQERLPVQAGGDHFGHPGLGSFISHLQEEQVGQSSVSARACRSRSRSWRVVTASRRRPERRLRDLHGCARGHVPDPSGNGHGHGCRIKVEVQPCRTPGNNSSGLLQLNQHRVGP